MNLTKLSFVLLFCCLAAVGFAQMNPVREMDKSMSFGTRPCFRLEFRNTEKSLVEEQWKEFAKTRWNAKLKKDKKSNEMFAEELSSSAISPNAFTIRSTVEKTGEDVALNVWFDLGNSFLNRREHPQSANEVVSILGDLFVQIRKEVVTGELKAAEKKLKDIESAKRKLEKENDGLHKDIENYKAKIKKAEDDIVKNEQDQNTNVADQEAQRKMIEEIRIRLQNVGSEKGN